MDKSIGNKLNAAGLNMFKRVPAAPAEAKSAQGAPAAKLAGDAMKLGGVKAAPAAKVGNEAAVAAELRLAKAYDADPVKFSENLIRASLEDLVSNLG